MKPSNKDEITSRLDYSMQRELERSKSSLANKISKLTSLGVLKETFSLELKLSDPIVVENSNKFETNEFYGDAVLELKISKFLIETRAFSSPHLLSQMRMEIDSLHLSDFSKSKLNYGAYLTYKQKADIVESLIGELAIAIDKRLSDGIHVLCTDLMDELIAFIYYAGETRFYHKHDIVEFDDKKQKSELKDVKSDIVCRLCNHKGHLVNTCPNAELHPVEMETKKEIPEIPKPTCGKCLQKGHLERLCTAKIPVPLRENVTNTPPPKMVDQTDLLYNSLPKKGNPPEKMNPGSKSVPPKIGYIDTVVLFDLTGMKKKSVNSGSPFNALSNTEINNMMIKKSPQQGANLSDLLFQK
jgi:hypothetical protein